MDEPVGVQFQVAGTRLANRYLRWGISGYPHVERRRLAIANLAGFLAALSCFGYAVLFAFSNFQALSWAVWTNLLCAGLYLLTPYWHRWGLMAAACYLTAVSYVSIFWFCSQFGMQSGTQLNFLTAIAISTVVIGNRWRWLVGAMVLGWGGHLYAHFWFRDPAVDLQQFAWLIQMLYLNAATTFVMVVGLVVWYAFLVAAEAEERAEKLLKNMLPDPIATRLKYDPDQPIADRFAEASVMFADLVGFTPIFGKLEPERMVGLLNEIFCRFDELCQQVGAEKIKTIGDAYMVVSGAPIPNDSHAIDLIRLAQQMLVCVREIDERHQLGLSIRIGIATGPLTAGVIGKAKFAYDVWAPTVNLASRLESNGLTGRIHVAEETRRAAEGHFQFEAAESKEIKGIGFRKTWLVVPSSS